MPSSTSITQYAGRWTADTLFALGAFRLLSLHALGRRNGLVVAALAIELEDASDIAGLQLAELLPVGIVHDLACTGGVIEADGVTDFVSKGVADVVALQVAVEAYLPAALGIEADERHTTMAKDAARRGDVIEAENY